MRWLVVMVVPVFAWALKPVGDGYDVYRNRFHPVPGYSYGKDGVRTYDRWLTKSVNSRVYAGNVVDASRAFFRDVYEDFKINPDELQVLKVDEDEKTESVLFIQTRNGIPVFDAQVRVVRNKQTKRFTFVSSRYRTEIALNKAIPSITASQAYSIARNALPFRDIRKYIEPQLVIYPRGKGILAYRVLIPSSDPIGDWEIFVDATTGKVFFVRDQAKYATGYGKAWVPDPLTTSHHYYNDNSYWKDNNDQDNDSLNGQRIDVELHNLSFDGTNYHLDGPWVHLDESIENPNSPLPAPSDSSQFIFTRSQQEFEAVMVYFHIDSIQRYFQNRLGITNANAEPQDMDPHGLDGADNSYYVPSSDYIAFGEGGVDDAEDADVIVHEYGHAVQDDIVPGWGSGGDAGAMGEGFGDYLATVWSMRVDTFRWADVFTWDGHNEFWPGRDCNNNMIYPDSLGGEVHHDGRLWCASLLDVIWGMHNDMNLDIDSALTIMDFLVLKHHFYLTSSATMPEAAQAIIQVDRDYYGGAHLGVIIPVFDARGFIDASDYVPAIYHDPLHDTEDQTGPYDVYAVVIPSNPPLDSVVLRYWTSLDPTEVSVPMTNTVGDTFHAQIPGPGTAGDVYYYILAADQNGVATHPAGAPSNYHSFHVGPDTLSPVIAHTPIGPMYPQMRWPAHVRATVTDNMGVDSVWVEWKYNGVDQGTFTLAEVSSNQYDGAFPLASVNIGDTIEYRIFAVDNSSNANVSVSPETGYYSFYITDALGVVLVINDDNGDRKAAKNGVVGEGLNFATGETADSIASWLEQMGYVVTLEDVSSTDTTQWHNYDFLVWSAGEDTKSVTDDQAPYSSAMIGALTNFYNSGGKIFFEGGEIGYDAQSDYPSFAQDILHITDWHTDNPNDLLLSNSSHPIATTPNTLPSTIARNDGSSGWGDGDGLVPASDAVIVFNVQNQSGDVGLVTSPNGRVVFLSVNFLSIADWNVAYDLLENIANYLMSVDESETIVSKFGVKAVRGGLEFQIPASVKGDLSISMYSIDGRRVFHRTLSSKGGRMFLPLRLPAGIYVYTVEGNGISLKGKTVFIK